jgi:hypothetical protein
VFTLDFIYNAEKARYNCPTGQLTSTRLQRDSVDGG